MVILCGVRQFSIDLSYELWFSLQPLSNGGFKLFADEFCSIASYVADSFTGYDIRSAGMIDLGHDLKSGGSFNPFIFSWIVPLPVSEWKVRAGLYCTPNVAPHSFSCPSRSKSASTVTANDMPFFGDLQPIKLHVPASRGHQSAWYNESRSQRLLRLAVRFQLTSNHVYSVPTSRLYSMSLIAVNRRDAMDDHP